MHNTIELLAQTLQEDRWEQDVTTSALKDFVGAQLKDRRLDFSIIAKQDGVFSGGEWVREIAKIADAGDLKVWTEGAVFQKGDLLVRGSALAERVLSFERSLLNGLARFCAIATQARRLTERVATLARERGLGVVPGLYHTRKTTPMIRDFEIAAVIAGGGKAHRRDLAERILVKENHKQLLALKEGTSYSEFAAFAMKRSVELKLPEPLFEVETIEEAKALVTVGCRCLMLDNFNPEQIRVVAPELHAMFRALHGRDLELEISGGVNEANLADYVLKGVDRISLGSLTHGVKSLDLSLDWKLA